MQACEVAALILLTVVSCSRQYEELPQTTLTLEPPFPEIFTGETVTLRCGVEGGSAGWKYLWYKDSEDTPVLQTAGRSITGDSYTITAAAVSDQGQYCCRGQRGDQPLYSQLSDKVTVTVSDAAGGLESSPKAVLTLQPAWSQIFTGETITLSCEVEGGSADWRFKQYRDGREEAGCSDQYSRRYGDSCTISYAQNSHNGVYWCESASGQERSNAVTLTVSNQWVILQTPSQPVIEGDTLTLRCLIRNGYKAARVAFYKDNNQLQYRAGTARSVDRVSKSDEGSYRCKAWWWNTASRTESWSESAEVWVSVRELFSTPTLTVLPGASVWEGEAVTLQCGAHINKQGTQLQYRYSKDNGTVRGAGSQDQHSIPAAGLRDTGRYQCEVEAAGTGLKKRSASVSLTVRALFSRVTLTASPGATVKEGEALNLTCEAAVNKTPRPELHYTIVRDGEPVTNSTDSALYSIASTEKSHTGSYTCAVESQGVKKSSQELHIEVETSWHSAVAIGYRVSFTLIHFIVFTLLLLQYCRIQGETPSQM
ncbi:Fc receptor-like protein 6 [Acipenser ruthenus]|uniref:Fc receptor-like protein 6 n=1 Tax=Acipenser ruthenus TaxID=7906 RepID=UPI0027409FF7|nr:Fc receptor-like protein 6 [Acipenser ruthenus]